MIAEAAEASDALEHSFNVVLGSSISTPVDRENNSVIFFSYF
jgi:hypothetical protein